MFFTNLIITTAVIAIPPHCLAHKSVLQPFLKKPYKLVSNDMNFDKVLRELDFGWLWRKDFEMERNLIELTWDHDTDIYTLTAKNRLTKIETPFKVVIILLRPLF